MALEISLVIALNEYIDQASKRVEFEGGGVGSGVRRSCVSHPSQCIGMKFMLASNSVENGNPLYAINIFCASFTWM